MKGKVIIAVFLLAAGLWACNNESEPKEKAETKTTVAPVPAENEASISPKLTEAQREEYLVKGKEIASATFKALSSELKAAMGRGGVEEAIQYCNISALPITDSLSQLYGATIRRAAERNRNPVNALEGTEKKASRMMTLALNNGEQAKPSVTVNMEGKTAFYAPIITNSLCLNCHGRVDEIGVENYSIIKALYPEDKAVDFGVGDLRGIWSITFNK